MILVREKTGFIPVLEITHATQGLLELKGQLEIISWTALILPIGKQSGSGEGWKGRPRITGKHFISFRNDHITKPKT